MWEGALSGAGAHSEGPSVSSATSGRSLGLPRLRAPRLQNVPVPQSQYEVQ